VAEELAYYSPRKRSRSATHHTRLVDHHLAASRFDDAASCRPASAVSTSWIAASSSWYRRTAALWTFGIEQRPL
jgi:hypothetical protein